MGGNPSGVMTLLRGGCDIGSVGAPEQSGLWIDAIPGVPKSDEHIAKMKMVDRVLQPDRVTEDCPIDMAWVARAVARHVGQRPLNELVRIRLGRLADAITGGGREGFLKGHDEVDGNDVFRSGIQPLNRALPFVEDRHMDRHGLEASVADRPGGTRSQMRPSLLPNTIDI